MTLESLRAYLYGINDANMGAAPSQDTWDKIIDLLDRSDTTKTPKWPSITTPAMPMAPNPTYLVGQASGLCGQASNKDVK